MSKSKHLWLSKVKYREKKTTRKGSESRLQTPALRRKKQVKQKNRALCANSSVSVFASSPLVKLSISLSQFVQRFASKYFQVKIVIIFSVGHG